MTRLEEKTGYCIVLVHSDGLSASRTTAAAAAMLEAKQAMLQTNLLFIFLDYISTNQNESRMSPPTPQINQQLHETKFYLNSLKLALLDDGRVGEGAVEPALGDVAVGGLGEVDAVPAPVVGWVLARVSPRLAALGRQVEVVLAHARSSAARTRLLPQESCAERKNIYQQSSLLASDKFSSVAESRAAYVSYRYSEASNNWSMVNSRSHGNVQINELVKVGL
jgi:hypothetical protein